MTSDELLDAFRALRNRVLLLERTAAEHRKIEEALRGSEARYRTLYHRTPVMLHSIDDRGRLVMVNDHWLEIMGYERSEVIGRPATEFMTEASSRYAREVAIPRLRATGVAENVEYRWVKKDGEEIDVVLSAVAELDENGQIDHSLAFIINVTDRKRSEEAWRRSWDELELRVQERSADLTMANDVLRDLHLEVERHAAELEDRIAERTEVREALRISERKHRALLAINNAIIANLDRDRLFAATSRALSEALAFDRSSLTLLDPERDILKVSGQAGLGADDGLLPETEFPRRGSYLQAVFDTGKALVRRDLGQRPTAHDEALHGLGLRSCVSVPLVIEGRVAGSLEVASREPDCYSEADVEFLSAVGQQVALAVGNMLAYEEIAKLKAQLEQENIYLQEELKTSHNFEEIVGRSPAIHKALRAVETVAPTEANVLLSGETGTGKELFARAVHNLSSRKDKPLVKINCAAIPAGLMESELFGHEKGAFTGAVSQKTGRFELADRGTLFLDEVGELPLDLQAKLLRVLQEGELERIGSLETRRVDVRVIAATNRDLSRAMEQGGFRPDLYYRLNVFPIELPPLRERTGDIPLLVRHFAAKLGAELGREVRRISRQVMDALTSYPWPGNVRELGNVIERGVILSSGSELEIGDWLPKLAEATGEIRIPTLDELQKTHILSVLELVGWRVSGDKGAARILGIKPTTLEARMKKLGIRRPGSKG